MKVSPIPYARPHPLAFSEAVGLSQNRVSEIVGNTNFGNIDTLFSQGHDMDYIARHYNMDLPLVWALRLERKTGHASFSLTYPTGKSKGDVMNDLR